MLCANTPQQRFAQGKPDVVIDLYLYPEENCRLARPIAHGWGCSCSKDRSLTEFWDGYPLLDTEMMPGERRRIGFVFMAGCEAVEALATTGKFFLWEGRVIGEAQIVC